jgi:hypothetical protein
MDLMVPSFRVGGDEINMLGQRGVRAGKEELYLHIGDTYHISRDLHNGLNFILIFCICQKFELAKQAL